MAEKKKKSKAKKSPAVTLKDQQLGEEELAQVRGGALTAGYSVTNFGLQLDGGSKSGYLVSAEKKAPTTMANVADPTPKLGK